MNPFGTISQAAGKGLRKMIAARENQIRLHVHDLLLGMDDESLKKAGLSRSELRKNSRFGSFI